MSKRKALCQAPRTPNARPKLRPIRTRKRSEVSCTLLQNIRANHGVSVLSFGFNAEDGVFGDFGDPASPALCPRGIWRRDIERLGFVWSPPPYRDNKNSA